MGGEANELPEFSLSPEDAAEFVPEAKCSCARWLQITVSLLLPKILSVDIGQAPVVLNYHNSGVQEYLDKNNIAVARIMTDTSYTSSKKIACTSYVLYQLQLRGAYTK